jgi:quercetin dioxygenase-like cupin family protein
MEEMMVAANEVRRHADGSTDFDFYRRCAARARCEARSASLKWLVSAIGRRLPAGHVRVAVFALIVALAGLTPLHARAQGGHAHHTMLLPHEMKWGPGPASLPPGAQAAMLEGNRAKAEAITVRLRFPAGYRIAPHTHPAIEHVTVLSGSFHMGAGEKFDEAKGKRLPVGGFAVMPVGTAHFAWTTEETVIQLHSVGPWGVTYVNPADDPRKK